MNSNRRDFLKKGSLGVLAASFVPFISKASTTPACEPTTEDILGPYFSEGAPQTNSIVPEDYEGEFLFLNGKLSTTNCEVGIASAVLDFWQADENGDYDFSETITVRYSDHNASSNYGMTDVYFGDHLTLEENYNLVLEVIEER